MTRSGAKQRSAYRREDGCWLIELRLREVRQLFHHLDPAPFREKDLDPAAEAYIEDALREIGAGQRARLVIHLPEPDCSSEEARSLPESIANYFGYRARQARVELGRLLRRALVNLAIGLLFLAACLALRRSMLAAGTHELLAEGLLIIGWVALWRPVEMFLYDWWPLLRRQRRLQAVAQMPVVLSRAESPPSPRVHDSVTSARAN
ncbi:conserved hypothetical protein, membrane [sediment metagenome]|uniref:Uncharacterized protein n=1 Tax=sediment metagenome TaxID=749907 RepID=D9PIS8_9ZZZZ